MTAPVSSAVTSKAHRLLVAGRLELRHVDGHGVTAVCRGDHGTYDVRLTGGRWECSCAAVGRCSHVEAVRLVTVAPPTAAADAAPERPGSGGTR